MAKNQVHPIESRAGVFGDFVTNLMAAIRRKGGTGAEIDPLVKVDGKETLDKVAEIIVSSAGNIIVVDYTKSLVRMITDCSFDGYVNPDITEKNFPMKRGPERVRMEEVHFNRYMRNEEVDAELKKRGLRDATLPEGLAWAKRHPDNQRKYPIAVRGSVLRSPDGSRNVPYLGSWYDERYLDLSCLDDDWDEYWRFLAVCES